MKKQIATVIGLLFAGSTVAQTQKGNGILSGNVSVTYNRQEIPRNGSLSIPQAMNLTTNWSPAIALTAGRFWTDNWLIGGMITGSSSVSHQYFDGTNDSRFTTNAVAVTPFVRRYWPVQSVYLFAGAGLSVGVNATKQPSYDNTGQVLLDGQRSSFVTVNPRLEVGLTYFLTNRLGLQLVASANALPLNVAALSAGLVYWTGPGRRPDSQPEQTNPQTDPGKWVIEGNFSVTSQTNKQIERSTGVTNRNTTSQYGLSPSVGYFIRKNSLLGVSIPVTYASTNVGTSSTSDVWSIGIAPYYQRYWSSTRLTPYTRATIGYMRISNKANAAQEIYTANSLNGGFTIGLAYMAGGRFIVETALLNASAVYLPYRTANYGNYSTAWTATVSAGLTGNFAVRYVL